MKRILETLLLLALAGCVPQKPPAYQVSEIQVLFSDATERWDYFYGDPQTIQVSGQSVRLERADPQAAGSVPEALAANGQPVLREVAPPWPNPLRASRSGSALVVRGQRAVRSAWVYENGWSRLTVQEGRNLLLPGAPRLEGLSEAENGMVLQEILARRGGRVVVLYQLEEPVLPALVLDPAPQSYRITAVEVQYGLESEGAVMGGNLSEVRVLRQGANSAYTGSAPQAFLATSASSFAQIWALATGNILPRPAAPEVNFSQYSIAAFFVGQKPTGGYGVRFVSATSSAGTWRITVELLQPAPGAILTQALTSPYLILELPGAASRVEFVDASGRLLSAATAR